MASVVDDWFPSWRGSPVFVYKGILSDLVAANATVADIVRVLDESQPAPGIRRARGIEDRLLNFQGRRYHIVLEVGYDHELGQVWFIRHFKPY